MFDCHIMVYMIGLIWSNCVQGVVASQKGGGANELYYSDLFTIVLIIIALLTYLNNRDNKRKK